MKRIDPKEASVNEVSKVLLGGVAPRPIALVSTLSLDGQRNLAPFSFFNAFGSNPPVVVFSPARRGRDGSVKDTYNNLIGTRECVIHAVTYSMVQQVSLASTEYPTGTDEFIKAGLTPVASEKVKPFRVAESPFQMECILRQMINVGDGPGSGNLAVCEVVLFHVAEDLFSDGIIHPDNIDLVGRNSADYYTRAHGSAVFTVKKPIDRRGIGVDQLPKFIRCSHILSANNLGQLANTEQIPTEDQVYKYIEGLPSLDGDERAFFRFQQRHHYRSMFRVARALSSDGHPKACDFVFWAAKCALDTTNDTDFAWAVCIFAHTRMALQQSRK